MNPIRYEIYDANVQIGEVSYPRPCIITSSIIDGCFSVVPLSSALELYEGLPFHLMIESTDPDFKATGLKHTSFATGDDIAELHLRDLIRKRGRLEGEPLRRFKKWIG